MERKRIFLASSSELREDRDQFRIMISEKNKDWISKGVFLELVIWEDFLDAMSKTRLQDEYNKAILNCDIFILLFFTKVGIYTEEEFEKAFKQFKETNRPFIFTYFKDAAITTGKANKKDLLSLWNFQEKLSQLGHFYTVYEHVSELLFKFNAQLDKLAANRFIQLKMPNEEDFSKQVINYNSYIAQLRQLTSENSEIRNKVEELNLRLEEFQKQKEGYVSQDPTLNHESLQIDRDMKDLISQLPDKTPLKRKVAVLSALLLCSLLVIAFFIVKGNTKEGGQHTELLVDSLAFRKKDSAITDSAGISSAPVPAAVLPIKAEEFNRFKEKAKSFDLNAADPKITLRFSSRKYDFTFSFEASKAMTLQTLMNALIVHFGFDKNITLKDLKEDEEVSWSWTMYVNYKEVEVEKMDETLKEARLKPNDIISLKKETRIKVHYFPS